MKQSQEGTLLTIYRANPRYATPITSAMDRRAIGHLRRRGLVRTDRVFVQLTDEGRAAAERRAAYETAIEEALGIADGDQ